MRKFKGETPIPYSQNGTSHPYGEQMYVGNIELAYSIPYTPQGQISDIIPPEDELYNQAIYLISKCIDVLECCIYSAKVIGKDVQLSSEDILKCLNGIFCNGFFMYNLERLKVSECPFLCCGSLLIEAYNAVSNSPNMSCVEEYYDVQVGLNNLAIEVFIDKFDELNNNCVISFSDFYNVVDVAFKLYSFLKKHSRYQDDVFYKPINDGFVYTFLSNLVDIFISVNSFVETKEKDIFNVIDIYNNMKKYFLNRNIDLFGLLIVTMLRYYDFHKELVGRCGKKVIEGEFDFHSLFIDLVKSLCCVYNIYEDVNINQKQLSVIKELCNVEMFKKYVETIKKNITEIFEFFSKKSVFVDEYKVTIEKGKIENVRFMETDCNDIKYDKFLGLVSKITGRKMYGNINKMNSEYFNNYNPLYINYIKNDDFLNNNASSDKEDDVKKPLEDIIDDVTSNHSSCCSCQRRRQ